MGLKSPVSTSFWAISRSFSFEFNSNYLRGLSLLSCFLSPLGHTDKFDQDFLVFAHWKSAVGRLANSYAPPIAMDYYQTISSHLGSWPAGCANHRNSCRRGHTTRIVHHRALSSHKLAHLCCPGISFLSRIFPSRIHTQKPFWTNLHVPAWRWGFFWYLVLSSTLGSCCSGWNFWAILWILATFAWCSLQTSYSDILILTLPSRRFSHNHFAPDCPWIAQTSAVSLLLTPDKSTDFASLARPTFF